MTEKDPTVTTTNDPTANDLSARHEAARAASLASWRELNRLQPHRPKFGRASFDAGLRSAATELLARLVREQLTHADFSALAADLCASPLFDKSTRRARAELEAFLQGGFEALRQSGQLVWRTRTESGAWVDCTPGSFGRVDAQIVWADTNKVHW